MTQHGHTFVIELINGPGDGNLIAIPSEHHFRQMQDAERVWVNVGAPDGSILQCSYQWNGAFRVAEIDGLPTPTALVYEFHHRSDK